MHKNRGLDIETMFNSHSDNPDDQKIMKSILMILSLLANPERFGEDNIHANGVFDSVIKVNSNVLSVTKVVEHVLKQMKGGGSVIFNFKTDFPTAACVLKATSDKSTARFLDLVHDVEKSLQLPADPQPTEALVLTKMEGILVQLSNHIGQTLATKFGKELKEEVGLLIPIVQKVVTDFVATDMGKMMDENVAKIVEERLVPLIDVLSSNAPPKRGRKRPASTNSDGEPKVHKPRMSQKQKAAALLEKETAAAAAAASSTAAADSSTVTPKARGPTEMANSTTNGVSQHSSPQSDGEFASDDGYDNLLGEGSRDL